MWTDDEDGEPLWVEEPEPPVEQRVAEFFERHRYDVVAKHDLGYDCFAEVTVEQLYEMFKLRYELEKEGHEF